MYTILVDFCKCGHLKHFNYFIFTFICVFIYISYFVSVLVVLVSAFISVSTTIVFILMALFYFKVSWEANLQYKNIGDFQTTVEPKLLPFNEVHHPEANDFHGGQWQWRHPKECDSRYQFHTYLDCLVGPATYTGEGGVLSKVLHEEAPFSITVFSLYIFHEKQYPLT